MTPEQQRIVIAEACGWTKRKAGNHWEIYEPNAKPGYYRVSRHYPEWPIHILPDYLNDLNAMHEAEKVLNDNQWASYFNNLTDHRLSTFQQQKHFMATATPNGIAMWAWSVSREKVKEKMLHLTPPTPP